MYAKSMNRWFPSKLLIVDVFKAL